MIEANSWESFKKFLNKPISRGTAMLYVAGYTTILFGLLNLAIYCKFSVFDCTSDQLLGLVGGELVILSYCWINYILYRNEK